MRKILIEASNILTKENITLEDYLRFREIGRNINKEEIRYFAQYDEGMRIRLPEIAQKEGNYNWLEPEDED